MPIQNTRCALAGTTRAAISVVVPGLHVSSYGAAILLRAPETQTKTKGGFREMVRFFAFR